MPKKLHDCVDKVKSKGVPENQAWPICQKSVGGKTKKKKGK